MTKWLRRVRGALGMGLAWAAGWALAGVLIGVTANLLPGLPWDEFFESSMLRYRRWRYRASLAVCSFRWCLGLQGAVAHSGSCRFPDAPLGERWVVCC